MLKILIAEDDMISRKLLWKILGVYGDCDLVVNGVEAIDAFLMAVNENERYDLVCLDIMMPKLDGISVLRTFRDLERQYKIENGCKAIMISALSEAEVVDDAFTKGANAYAPKPLDIDRLMEVMRNFELID